MHTHDRICISTKLPGDRDAAGPGNTRRTSGHGQAASKHSNTSMSPSFCARRQTGFLVGRAATVRTQTHRKKNTNEKEFKWIFERKLQTDGFLRRAEIWDLSRECIYTRTLRICWRGSGLGSTGTPKGRSEAAATNLHPEWTAPKFPAHQAARPSMHPKNPAEGSRATQAPRRSPGVTHAE